VQGKNIQVAEDKKGMKITLWNSQFQQGGKKSECSRHVERGQLFCPRGKQPIDRLMKDKKKTNLHRRKREG